jgi:hypothetical protein
LEPFEVFNGLDQGCPASGPYFLFYNKGLLNILKSRDEIASAFIDDSYLAARVQNIEETYNMLKQMMTRPQGVLEWAQTHNSKFELDKSGLMTFTHKRVPDPTRQGKTIPLPRPPIVINGHPINSSPTIKFLGIILDQEL